jgi:hypothetical protein
MLISLEPSMMGLPARYVFRDMNVVSEKDVRHPLYYSTFIIPV